MASGGDPALNRHHPQSFGGQLPTFEAAARAFHAENMPTWRNAKHAAQVLSTLATYAFLRIGPLPVDEVTEAQVRSVLIAIWLEKLKTARRLRRRINAVMDWTPRTDGRLGGILRKRRMNGRGGPAAFAPATRTHIASIMFWSVGRQNDPRRPAKPAHANARDVGCQRQYPRRRWDGLSAHEGLPPTANQFQFET